MLNFDIRVLYDWLRNSTIIRREQKHFIIILFVIILRLERATRPVVQ